MIKLLPVGSIVSISEKKNDKVLIVGRVVRKELEGKVFDYCGCNVPKGLQEQEDLKIFNHKDIKRLLFVGYQDEEEIKFSHFISIEKEKLSKSDV